MLRGDDVGFFFDGVVGVTKGKAALTAGAWKTVPIRGRGSELAGTPADEGDLWVQASLSIDHGSMAAGLIRSTYHEPRAPTVTEVYANLRLDRDRWSSSVSWWTAVKGASGTYVEPAIAWHHAANPFGVQPSRGRPRPGSGFRSVTASHPVPSYQGRAAPA
jgi:hypothetical protein